MQLESVSQAFWDSTSPCVLHPGTPHLITQLESLPSSAGVYAFEINGEVTHLSWSANLSRRLRRLLLGSSESATGLAQSLRNASAAVYCWVTSSKLETSLVLYRLAKTHFPSDYVRRLHLRSPWFLGITSANPFPRLTVFNRVSARRTATIGPFPNRDLAQLYEQQVLGFFQIRRCTENLAPGPAHPGCIYGEMNQCLRPCQCAVTAEEYATEVARVADFLSTNGKSTTTVLASARDRASSEMDFEQAAHIHSRLEKLQACAALRDPVVRDIPSFHGLALTRGSGRYEFRLWPMLSGLWQRPITLDVAPETSGPRSLDQTVREQLEQSVAHPRLSGDQTEELALFSRWYYSSWRDGSWYPFRTVADLNYRRLVREVSKLVRDSGPS